MLDDLLEDDQVGLHESAAKDLHNLLLLPPLIPRRVEEDHALDGRLEEATHHLGVGSGAAEAGECRGDGLEAEEEIAEEEAGICEGRVSAKRRALEGRQRTATHP